MHRSMHRAITLSVKLGEGGFGARPCGRQLTTKCLRSVGRNSWGSRNNSRRICACLKATQTIVPDHPSVQFFPAHGPRAEASRAAPTSFQPVV